MPDLQHNDFTLLNRQFTEVSHCRLSRRGLVGLLLKPSMRFQFTRQAPPHRAPVIEDAIAERANGVVPRLGRRHWTFKQRNKRFLQNILGLGMAQAERAPIQQQFGGTRFVKSCTPMFWRFFAHVFTA